jgi:hypothetical protein
VNQQPQPIPHHESRIPKPESLHRGPRQSISQSIRVISIEDLKALGERLFPLRIDTWREKYFRLIAENPGEKVLLRETSDGFEVVYCHAKTRASGIWGFRRDRSRPTAGPFEADRRQSLTI